MSVFNLRSSALIPAPRVIGLRGREGLSRLFEFDVYFTSRDPELDLGDALTAKATLTIEHGAPALGGNVLKALIPPHEYHGILSSMRLLRATRESALYVARLVPQVWQLSQTRHSRIWTKKSIREVVTEILTEASLGEGAEFEFVLKSPPQPEEHICQYKESDLAFLQRWFEREGWYYFFDHTGGTDKLVITDSLATHTALAQAPVRYHPTHPGDRTASNAFEDFTCTHVVLPSNVRVADYDYGKPMLDVSSTAVVSATGAGDVAEYGHRLFSPGEATRIAKVRSEDHRAREVVYHASGAATHITSGFLFTLDAHPRGKMNTAYLATEVAHFGSEPSLSKNWGANVPTDYPDEPYRVEVTAIEATKQYRHGRVTPWPRIDGFENAVVDGAARSQYAQIDADGRYAIKFKFDEGPLQGGKASTFVRMAQPHGGSVEGFHFPLRKGTEVVCAFLGGDPDRPIITAVVPNAVTPSPVVATNHTQNIIQTGSESYITIEDSAGAQFMNLYCPTASSGLYLGVGRGAGGRGTTSNAAPLVPASGPGALSMSSFSFDLRSEGHGQVSAGGDLNINADARLQVNAGAATHVYYGATLDRDVQGAADELFHSTLKYEVTGAVDIDYDATLNRDVKGAAIEHFLSTMQYTVDGTSNITYTGASTYTYGATRTSTVTGLVTDTFDAGHTTTITGARNLTVNGTETMTINGDRIDNINANVTTNITGNHTHTTTGSFVHDVAGSANVTNNGALSWIKNSSDASVSIGAKATAQLSANAELNIGAKLSMNIAIEAVIAASVKLSIFAFEAQFKGVKGEAAGAKLNAIGSKMETLALKMMGHGADVSFGGVTLKG